MMTNRRYEPLSYRPFRTQPLLADGLLAVARPGGNLLERVSEGLFRVAAEAGDVADRQAARAGALAGQRAALNGRPHAGFDQPAGAGEGSGQGQQLTGKRAEKAARAKAYLMEKHGVSNEFASGLVGQFAQESGFNTRAVNPGDGTDGSDSIGIAQWNGKRARALRQFAAARGKPADDFETQLDFVMHELGTTEKAVGNRLRAARTVEEATAAAIGYERPRGWTPENPKGGHGWSNRLAAAQSVYGVPAAGSGAGSQGADNIKTGSTPSAAAGSPAQLSGGTFRPTGRDTVYGRAYDEAGAKTYVQLVETEMRSTTSQLFAQHRDDPVALAKALDDNRADMLKQHVFPEIEGDFEVAYGQMAERFLGQARENLARKTEAQDKAAFFERTSALETDQQRQLADFDPGSADAADAIASSQAALDAHYDDAVRRGVLDPDSAAKAKLVSRRNAALGYYGKQAEALDAAGIAEMRKEMERDFAGGGIPGLDGDGWATLDTGLKKLEAQKRSEADRITTDFRKRGDAMAARIVAGYDVDPAELSKMMLESGDTPAGKEAMQETFAKISAGRFLRDMSVKQGETYVAGLKKQYGDQATDSQLRTLAFADGMLQQKKKAIATDSVSYAEAHNIVPATPFLTDAETADDLAATMERRVETAADAARELGTAPRYLKAGEAKALADAVKADPTRGVSIAGAIVAGAGDKAPAVLSEFGTDAPMIAEAGAIIAFGGSARAAEDVIGGYGKDPAGKALKDMKPATTAENFRAVTGNSMALTAKDASRINRAASAITRKRVNEMGIDPTSDEAVAIHTQAIHEAAGAVFDRGVQFGGFTDFGGGIFTSGSKVLVPSSIRADAFGDVLAAITDADLNALPIKPKAGISFFMSTQSRAPRSLAATLADGVPVAVPGGYAFALGDPTGDDPQFIMGEDGNVFVLDIEAMRDRLAPRVPGAFR